MEFCWELIALPELTQVAHQQNSGHRHTFFHWQIVFCFLKKMFLMFFNPLGRTPQSHHSLLSRTIIQHIAQWLWVQTVEGNLDSNHGPNLISCVSQLCICESFLYLMGLLISLVSMPYGYWGRVIVNIYIHTKYI